MIIILIGVSSYYPIHILYLSFDSSDDVREVMTTSLLYLYFDTNIPLEIRLLNGDAYAYTHFWIYRCDILLIRFTCRLPELLKEKKNHDT